MKKYIIPLTASLIASFLFVMIYAYGSTTISTNINTGGTLTVSGVTTLSSYTLHAGALLASSTLTVDGVIDLNGTIDIDGVPTFSTNLVFDNAATTTVTMTNGLNFDSNTFVIDPNAGTVGIATSSASTGAKFAVGNGTAATTTIDFSKACFRMDINEGGIMKSVYFWPCVAQITGLQSCPGGWATSTDPCND